MTKDEAARRLGVPEHHVLDVSEHVGGHVVRVRGGRLMLVSATVARTYVPEVDDAPAGPAAEAVAEPVVESLEPAPTAKPKGKPKAGRSAGGTAA